jgi:hypothetical protein
MIKAFKKLQAKDADLNRVQANIEQVLTPILDSKVVDSLVLKDVEVVSGNNVVSHKLGRTMFGYLVIRKSANIDIYDIEVSKTTLTLNCSGAATISVLVF